MSVTRCSTSYCVPLGVDRVLRPQTVDSALVVASRSRLLPLQWCSAESLIKDLKREAHSLSRETRQAIALGLEGGPPFLENCSARHD